tara:strand:+ start:3654 stop:4145 length:492 start_codon:yes stop_codon:yes gene_type:complete
MKKTGKTILIISSALLVTGIATYFLFFKKPKDGGDDSEEGSTGGSTGSSAGSSTGGSTGGSTGVSTGGSSSSSAVGKIAQVKGTSTNVREGACTDTSVAVNAKGTGTIIGTVENSTLGCNDSSGQYIWYYVVLTKELKDESSMFGSLFENTHGWVREDVVKLM